MDSDDDLTSLESLNDDEEGGEGFVVEDGTDDSLSGSDLSDSESEAQPSDDDSDNSDSEDEERRRYARSAPGIEVELAYTELCVILDLENHPIHGPGRGRETNEGFIKVPNYVHPFIRAEDAPEHVWPHNAADWGFIEVLPSQTDMTPNRKGGRHPALDEDGVQVMVDHRVNAAFYYKLPEGVSRHPGRRSCRITNWSIDPQTEEAIPDRCWGCRRFNKRCVLRQERFPRRYLNGIPYEGYHRSDYPANDNPQPPTKEWTDAEGRDQQERKRRHRHHRRPRHRRNSTSDERDDRVDEGNGGDDDNDDGHDGEGGDEGHRGDDAADGSPAHGGGPAQEDDRDTDDSEIARSTAGNEPTGMGGRGSAGGARGESADGGRAGAGTPTQTDVPPCPGH